MGAHIVRMQDLRKGQHKESHGSATFNGTGDLTANTESDQ